MEEPKPAFAAKVLYHYKRSSIVYAFRTFEEAKTLYERSISAVATGADAIDFEHASGRATVLVRGLTGATLIDRISEDDNALADLPYQNRLEERERDAGGRRPVGIGADR